METIIFEQRKENSLYNRMKNTHESELGLFSKDELIFFIVQQQGMLKRIQSRFYKIRYVEQNMKVRLKSIVKRMENIIYQPYSTGRSVNEKPNKIREI